MRHALTSIEAVRRFDRFGCFRRLVPASSQTHVLTPQSRPPSYPARSVRRRALRPSHSARRCGNVPARRGQTKDHACPGDDELWLHFPHPRLPLRISVDVSAVVVEEIALNLCLPGRVEKCMCVCPQVWIIELDIRMVSDVARLCHCERQEVFAQGFFMSRPVCPKCSSCDPIRPEALL